MERRKLFTDDGKEKAIVAAGGAATGGLLGRVVGESRATKKFKARMNKTQGRRDISAARDNLKAVEEYRKTGDASKLSKKIEELAKHEERNKSELEKLGKKVIKSGKRKGVLIGAGLGLVGGMAGYEYLKNPERDWEV